MTQHVLREDSITVPNTGVDGLVHVLRGILKHPKVQSIHIDARGKITYSRYVPEGDPVENTGLILDTLTPGYVVQGSDVQELSLPDKADASLVLGHMFAMAAEDHMQPLAFVSGANTVLWSWYHKATGIRTRATDTFFGLPVYLDRVYDDDLLLLCVGYGRDAGFADTRVSYKVLMENHDKAEKVGT